MRAARTPRAALATILLAAAAFGAPPERSRREARSSAETWKTKDGRRMEHTVNRRFTFARIRPERFGGSDVLLEETFDRLLDSGAEGEKSSVEVAAFSLAGKPLWTVRTSGASGEAREDDLYRIVRPGCCGAQDLSAYFSLLDGRELFTADTPIVTIDVPNSSLRRFAAYHDLMAATPVRESGKNVGVVGALSYGSDRRPGKRVLILSADAKPDEKFAAKRVSLVSAGKEIDAERFDLWSADKSEDPGRIGGFSIRVRAFTEPDLLFEIPVEGDRLVIEKATLGKGIRLVETE